MRKRLSRRARKRRMKLMLLLLLGAAALAGKLAFSGSDNSDSNSYDNYDNASEDEMFISACNEVYADMQTETWNPLADDNDEKSTEDTSEEAQAEQKKPSEDGKKKKSSAGDKPYPENWNESEDTEIIPAFLSGYSGKKYIDLEGGGQVANCTSHSNSELLEESTLPPAFKISVNEKPQVLIMHTHTTETYEPYEREHFDPSFNYRTTDSSRNVVAVGEAIAEKLRSAGIVTIHDETIHDYPSYTGAYERSAETVKAILAENPSIKVVLDIHRDAIGTEESITQPVAEINGKKAAQIMIISGCDDGTMDMPDYMFNFRFACKLQQQAESMYEGLTRPVLFDYRHYNQDLTTGSLLIETGSHGNTIEQAVYAGSLLGDALAEVLLSLH